MPTDNAAQIADWNGPVGQRWAELHSETDSVVRPFGEAALKQAAAQRGERVIDIGCGCGDTSVVLAQAVGDSGAVLGVDVSHAMLAVARQLAGDDFRERLRFVEADASAAALPAGVDLLFSRFGVMFFADPVAAFTHLRASLKPGGRCVFVCWRTPRDNPWAMAPLVAARAALGVTPAPSDPTAPGPFAFADEARLRGILDQAGFRAIDVQRFDAAVLLGPTPRAAAQNALRFGPTSRLVRDQGVTEPAALVELVGSVATALAAASGSQGAVHLNGSSWIVSAAA